uniref:GST N-terminal domain-containing protein n=1 Tax=Caenorhabditis tropicalis TaxID=1561998 RepID=A0A1I7U177_9PELO
MKQDLEIIYFRDPFYYTVMFPDTNGNENGNGVMKTPQRETVVSLGFTEDPIPPSHYCCNTCHIQKACKTVAIFAIAGFVINIILYFMGISKLGLNGYLEAFLLIFDCISLLTLLCGVSKQRSGLLKPYLFYNVSFLVLFLTINYVLQTIWNFGMIILFLVFVYHMLKGTSDVSRNILENVKSLRSNPDEYHFRSRESFTTAIVVTLGVMAAMALVIVINCLFLHVVYRTFQFFAYQEEKRREEMDKKERL